MTVNNPPRCPVCGQIMYQTRRGATLRKRGPAWLCPKDEAETWTDETGQRHRLSESQHKPALRVWEDHELSCEYCGHPKSWPNFAYHVCTGRREQDDR